MPFVNAWPPASQNDSTIWGWEVGQHKDNHSSTTWQQIFINNAQRLYTIVIALSHYTCMVRILPLPPQGLTLVLLTQN